MKLLTKENEELVNVSLSGGKDELLKAKIQIGALTLNSPGVETKMAKVDSGLQVSIRVPDLANFKIVLETADIKALKSMMNKDVLGFLMKSLF
jgi:hypothetical protein